MALSVVLLLLPAAIGEFWCVDIDSSFGQHVWKQGIFLEKLSRVMCSDHQPAVWLIRRRRNRGRMWNNVLEQYTAVCRGYHFDSECDEFSQD